ncbi:bifunctional metallophosphatase/5'-nucleotidase [Paraburkholderia sp. JHI869]|uniref:bifunctional metallophosphatase/5'-nucleotidase n=1 Tax=Paraburkholderia sp. JHI869 TaxID=3112959 RepID=UPI00317474B5
MNKHMRFAQRMAIFPQINDFYHIDALADPTDPASLLLPHVGEIVNRLRKHYERDRVIFCLPGDFLNPSYLSQIFSGEQMIDVLNTIGVNAVTLGNHEFDFDDNCFTPSHLIRLIEKCPSIHWLASNRLPWEMSSVAPTAETRAAIDRLILKDALLIHVADDHTIVLLGLMKEGLYEGFFEAGNSVECCERLIRSAKDKQIDAYDVLRKSDLSFVAMTHQDVAFDEALVDRCAEIRLIIGGHDHDVAEPQNRPNIWDGEPSRSLIVKAKSNARTMCVSFVNWFPEREVRKLVKRYQTVRAVMEKIAKTNLEQLLRTILLDNPNRGAEPPVLFQELCNELLPLVYRSMNIHGFNSSRTGQIASFSVDACLVLDMLDTRVRKLVSTHAETQHCIERWTERSRNHIRLITISPCLLELENAVIRRRSTNFGNFVADVISGRQCKRSTNRGFADIGFVTAGTFQLQRNIVAGEAITNRTMYDSFCYANSIVLFTGVAGHVIRDIMQVTLTELQRAPARGDSRFLQISGIEVDTITGLHARITCVDAVGKRSLLDDNERYSVATSNYVAATTHFRRFFADLTPTTLESCLRTSVTEELEALNGQFMPDKSNRWIGLE